ncbi:glutathione S-transferase family protein [Salinarimonas ramus]|uniref:Thiol:disulfide oxidoreductase n=1 Tax=Salinarimonas ramus TaxID=690164 RepID=A0A917V306_9HYPH|nr:glutathione S-transferase family protein [Salinarimonas ramus]GGK32534.1 thiol:disulfide oxidoreductase [Salinarimonas ramus]
MPDAVLYHARSGNSLRAAIAVELAGISVTRRQIDLAAGEHKRPDYLAVNPAGTVPAFVEGPPDAPLVLTQSGAILEHLVDRSRPDLWPQDASARAACRASVLCAVSDVAVQNALARYLAFAPEASRFVFERAISALLAALEPLARNEFLCGPTPSVADYAHFPVVYMREAALRRRAEARPVIAWLERLMRDDAVSRAIAYAGLQLDELSP